jgi:hypothetical protein
MEGTLNDEKKNPLQQVLDELRDPWDWTAALVGAAGGAAVTIFAHGADLGHSIPTGALTAIAGRRTILSSFGRPRLRKKAYGLLSILNDDSIANQELVTELGEYIKKWDKKIITSDVLENKIAQIAEKDTQRKISAAQSPSTSGRAVAAPSRRITLDD